MPTIAQWTKHLAEKIASQATYAAPLEERYETTYVLPFLVREYAQVYGTEAHALGEQIRPPRSGAAAITVDALTDRLTVLDAVASDLAGDDPAATEAARVVRLAWERNDLDVMHREAHREALIKAVSFAQVGRSADGLAVVGIEAAEQMAVHRQSEPPYDIDAAMKISVDEWTSRRRARLWLLDQEVDLVEAPGAFLDPQGSGEMTRWTVTNSRSRSGPIPVVEFQSRPRLLADPVSEIALIETLVDIVDLADGLMVFAGHFGAVPIRYGTGLDVPRDPKDPSKPLLGKDGKPFIGFNPRADHMWVSTNEEAKFGQLTPAALESFVTWGKHATDRIRARSQVASTYFSVDLKSHMTAELLKTDESPMVRRVRSIGERGSFGQSWRKLMGLTLAIERPDLAGAPVRPLWEDPATRIESQDADRFSKLAPYLDPQVLAEEVLGWSPEKAGKAVEGWLERQSEDPLLATLSGALVLPDAA